MTQADFIGVGVGPGDPELITLKAMRLIRDADVISYIANKQGQSQAKSIAAEALAQVSHEQLEIPVVVPMCNDRRIANKIYDEAACAIHEQVRAGKRVVFICEGDPLFFGSFTYLLDRLQDICACQVVPGISSVHAAASALQHPLTLLKESFAVLSGRHSDDQLVDAFKQHDSVVVMKAGQARPRILAALEKTGRMREAQYLENIGRRNEVIVRDAATLTVEAGPYFSLFVVTRAERDRA